MWFALLACWAGIACDSSRSADEPEVAMATASPAQVARELWEAHERRDYSAITERIIPSQRERAVQTLRAIDDVILANKYLQETAEQCYRGPMAETWSLAEMENNLGVFSRRVSYFNQTIRCDVGEVTIQEGDNIPLLHATFVFQEGRWLYQPEPTPVALTRELQMLSSALWRLCDKVKSGASMDVFTQTFAREVEPQIVRAMTVTDEGESVAAAHADTGGGDPDP